jgi:hypothetical protein
LIILQGLFDKDADIQHYLDMGKNAHDSQVSSVCFITLESTTTISGTGDVVGHWVVYEHRLDKASMKRYDPLSGKAFVRTWDSCPADTRAQRFFAYWILDKEYIHSLVTFFGFKFLSCSILAD